ncbi:protein MICRORCHIDIA 6-like isoform X1 [Corylus avellana]|uniref:protein MICRORCHIDIA 6-like isoform X1 n=1 Tax=Corylus avellana TaxID=13451 RepID=UPI00286D0353|nr:protein MICRORCHIDIA 6-like isoform X1 [Corylus avellana]XP_059443513.1 protein MICRORCHIDIA 6-like isoform X1 [Corylus avellana]
MSFIDIVDLSSDDECGHLNVKAVKLEPGIVGGTIQQKENEVQLVKCQKSETQCRRQESEESKSSNSLSTGKSSSRILDRGQSPLDDTSLPSTSPMCPAPLCRQFWKAGNYDDGLGSKVSLQNGKNYLHVHPLFLHSNATSHKWAFGAVAELLDNAVDEIQNGATFVLVDKTTNPKDGSPALLIQDDGGGMDPAAMRHCMSFGFSDKKSKSAIGQYGNGFKTSTMRLGADVIVFSRHLSNRTLTQSIGLLSYTFLTRTGHDRIVVPMVDYEFNTSTGTLEILHGKEHFMSNLSMLLQWSPFLTEAELLKQFDDIGAHGTKAIIYNLWVNDDGDVELDFESDPEDIRVSGETKKIDTLPALKTINEQHIANQFHYSLRVYLSILYLRVPERFNIILRGRVVEYHNIANDLKFPECILYRPQGCVEGQVITTVGFLKEAPRVGFHGFNVYHKNRLILPFWQVVSYQDSRGRGVVGVLEANFIEPTHNKQDFERTSLFQKLEARLKEMTWEYWDYHCGLIGYQPKKIPRAPVTPQVSSRSMPQSGKQLVMSKKSSPAISGTEAALGRAEQSISKSPSISELGLRAKRKEHGDIIEVQKAKWQAVELGNANNNGHYQDIQPPDATGNQPKDQEAVNLLQENRKLRAKCLEHEKREEELNLQVTQLKIEIEEVQHEYDRMLGELDSLSTVKDERNVLI